MRGSAPLLGLLPGHGLGPASGQAGRGLGGDSVWKGRFVAQQRPQHVDAAAGHGDQSLLVFASFGAFALVVARFGPSALSVASADM